MTKLQHGDRMLPSRLDDVLLAAMIEEKIIELVGLHHRIYGTQLQPPGDLKLDMMRWRTMRNRYKCKSCGSGALAEKNGQVIIERQTNLPHCSRCYANNSRSVRWQSVGFRNGCRGDYQHRESEMISCRVIAEWTVVLNAQLRNQEKVPVIDWGNRDGFDGT